MCYKLQNVHFSSHKNLPVIGETFWERWEQPWEKFRVELPVVDVVYEYDNPKIQNRRLVTIKWQNKIRKTLIKMNHLQP